MSRKEFVIFVVITVLIAGVALFLRVRLEESGIPPSSSGSTGLIIGANAIYVAEQAPSKTLTVAVVRLEKPGFVVVHEDVAGAPGGILGASAVLPAGETHNLSAILLSRMTRDGETLYAMLHVDDGDGVFDAGKDKPVLDPVSASPMMMIVTVSAEAVEPGAVSL
ncbi:MAG: hypothetical protein HYS15_01455 [Candidatus Spechtbacteria bacterium]|nr:hypothetical protein [Candidatus Spechtbacteria bacterium]